MKFNAYPYVFNVTLTLQPSGPALYVATFSGQIVDTGFLVASVSGTCRGRIGRERRGTEGFGYDPLFLPDARPGKTMAELSPGEKDAISHRGKALRTLAPLVAQRLGPRPGSVG